MKPRVLHCPTSTGGQAWYLSRAERKLGYQSDVLITHSHPFAYPVDRDLRLQTLNPISKLLRKWQVFHELIDAYDVFHFNYGSSLLDFPYLGLHHLDFQILKKKNKKIIVTYQGCDARISRFCRKNFSTSVCHQSKHWHCSWPADQVKLNRIKKTQRYADHVFALNPDLLYNIPQASLLLYAFDVSSVSLVPFDSNPKTFKILHAPSNPQIKGTALIQSAVNQLIQEGYPVELQLLMGKNHEEALELYRESHLVVDQLFAGWYGAFAVEVMAMGKPVLCYLREEDLKRFVPFQQEIPMINVSQESLIDGIKKVITETCLRHDLSLKSRAYVENYHDADKIAAQVVTEYC